MKKLVILLISFFVLCGVNTFASEKKEVRFIYINGSNNNDKKMKDWFYEGMQKMHPHMKNSFLNSSFINKNLLLNGEYTISDEPEAFFWGDRSNEEIQTLNSDLRLTKIFSPKLAQTVRSLLAHCLHDAIWVSHYRNMRPVIQDLHKQVMANYKEHKPVILFGYSAGAFVTYEYMFNKLPSIDPQDYFKQANVSDEFLDFINQNPQKETCIDALVDSGLAVYSAEGKLVPSLDYGKSKDIFYKLNEYTCQSCVPKDALFGIVNFASPLVLFYSDISNPNYPLTYYNKLLYKYILENKMFWLTVNYSDDPLGYPTTKNISYKDLKDKVNVEIHPNEGFLYSKSDIKSRRTFIGAHTSYWATSKKFSKAVVDAYIEGYLLYNDNYL